METLEGSVDVNKGMPTPPTISSELNVELGPSMIPVPNGAVLMPASSILSQTRDVLYSQNHMNYPNTQNLHENIRPNRQEIQRSDVNMHNNRHIYLHNTEMQQPGMQVTEQPQRPFMNNSSQNVNIRSSTTSDAPPWVNNMLQGLDSRLQQIENQLNSQNSNWQNIDSTLKAQCARMTNIQMQINDLKCVKQKVDSVENSIRIIDKDVREINLKMRDCEESTQVISDLCEDVQSEQNTMSVSVNALYEKIEKLEFNQEQMTSELANSTSAIIDLQCRSMRENLIFTGIKEQRLKEGEYEDTEGLLREFLKYEMQIERPIHFHRVHRIGPYERNFDTPRPVVAKFERFKDREEVRSAAPRTLKGKPYGVREQFPKVVEDKRKLLYPEMKRAKHNKQNKVRLVRDKLYVNNVEIIPDPRKGQSYERKPRQEKMGNIARRYPHEQPAFPKINRGTRQAEHSGNFKKDRVFYSRPPSQNSWSQPRLYHNAYQPTATQIVTSNKYSPLSEENEISFVKTSETRKHKASSPLDDDKYLKKQRENSVQEQSDSDSDSSITINIDKSPQCEPPSTVGRTINQSPVQTFEMPKGLFASDCQQVNTVQPGNQPDATNQSSATPVNRE